MASANHLAKLLLPSQLSYRRSSRGENIRSSSGRPQYLATPKAASDPAQMPR